MNDAFSESNKNNTDLSRKIKSTVKDSVFRSLFNDPKYTLQLYRTLHPEDTDVTEADITNITINNVMLNQMYNDCSFVVRKKYFIMAECQSTWSLNIVVRQLIYYANDLHQYIMDTNQNPYSSRKLEIPAPEFYIIYSGPKADVPEWISISKEFFDGNSEFLEINAKVLTGGGDDIISQFVDFTKILDEQRKAFGKNEKTIHETVRICKEKNILVDYLKEREKEVVSMLMALYDNDTILHAYEHEIMSKGREEGRMEGREEGRMEGRTEGRMEVQQTAAENMWKKGFSADEISSLLEVDKDLVTEWLCQSVAR